MKENKEEIEVQIFSSASEYEIKQICAILTENNIPFIIKNDGSGSYMNLYMGQSIQEKRVFVSKDDYDKSINLISSFISNDIDDIDTEETFETDEEVENDESGKKYILMRRGIGFLILGFPVFLIILLIIISLTQQ